MLVSSDYILNFKDQENILIKTFNFLLLIPLNHLQIGDQYLTVEITECPVFPIVILWGGRKELSVDLLPSSAM